jgi:hypothetical protein
LPTLNDTPEPACVVPHFDAMTRGLVAAERIIRRGNRYFPALGVRSRELHDLDRKGACGRRFSLPMLRTRC